MTTYSHTTFAALKSQLALRLGDATKVHWTDDELGMYLVDAIRTFNALSSTHRTTIFIPTVAGTAFYDLPNSAAELAYTVTDYECVGLMQYQLMEPKSPAVWIGSEMFTLPLLVNALERRRNQFLADTAIRLVQRSYPIGAVDTLDLPDSVVNVLRAVWSDGNGGRYYQINRTDEDTLASARRLYRQTPASVPSSFSVAACPNLTLSFAGEFAVSGVLELLTIESGTPLSTTANGGTGTILGIPDDYCAGPRYGALADLLRADGPARDDARASYCESVYQFYVDLARSVSVILSAYINGVSVLPSALSILDAANFGWQSRTTDSPTAIGIVAPNLIAAVPVPDGEYSISLDVVRSAIVPVADGDYIQVSRDDLGGILAWAETLATFKSQGASFDNARKQSGLLLSRASEYANRRRVSSAHLDVMLGQSTADRAFEPAYGLADNGSSDTSGGDPTSLSARDSASSHQSRARSNAARSQRRRLGGR